MAYRFDRGTLRSPRKTADGRMVVDALLSRTGVYVYRNADGTERREYRPDSTVFAPAAMKSFELKPFTQLHPMLAVGDDEAAAKAKSKGLVLEGIHRDGIHMVGSILIEDAELFAAMQRGELCETSCGYEVEIDPTPGVAPSGERYDVMQTSITGDHVAAVPAGRAGSSRVKMDRADAWELVINSDSAPSVARDNNTEGLNMKELEAALKEAAEHKVRADRAEADLKIANEAKSKIEGERDGAIKRADAADAAKIEADKAADKARTDGAIAQPEAVKARVALERKAVDVLGADAKIGDKLVADADDTAVMLAVVKRVDGEDVDVKIKGASYLAGRFDAACVIATKGAGALAAFHKGAGDRKDVAGVSTDKEEAARQRMIEAGRYNRSTGAK